MQKFLLRNPCAGGPIFSNSSHILTPRVVLIHLGFNRTNTEFTFRSLGFSQNNSVSFSSSMPSAAATAAGMATAVGCRNPFSSGNTCSNSPRFASSSSYTCRNCRCSVESANAVVHSRAWSVLKENRRGSRVAWFHTSVPDKGVSVSAMNCEDDSESSGGDGEKSVKLNRRHRGGGGNAQLLLAGNPDLLAIPGVGPRNLRKLVENGIGGVAELKKIYKDKFFGKSNQKMVEFLRSSVGIVHRNHAESITTFIKHSVDEELKDDRVNTLPQKKRLTFCVEGNISVGKTTFLQRIANETLELQDLVEIVPEPIDKWQDIGPDHFNILDAFYAEPERYAYTFQNYVFVTRVMQEKESSSGIKPLRLMERSVFSDRMVCVML